jgi:hypothetical protein
LDFAIIPARILKSLGKGIAAQVATEVGLNTVNRRGDNHWIARRRAIFDIRQHLITLGHLHVPTRDIARAIDNGIAIVFFAVIFYGIGRVKSLDIILDFRIYCLLSFFTR